MYKYLPLALLVVQQLKPQIKAAAARDPRVAAGLIVLKAVADALDDVEAKA